jgi:glutaredoxin
VVLVACGGNPVTDDVPGAARGDGTTAEGATTDAAGARVTPPFDVRGELDGLLLVWFDADGLHSAQKRADIPEASRAEVRVDSLKIPPDKRLDPEHVYVADVRAPGADGSYAVTKRTRAWFESRMDALAPKPAAEPAAAGAALADTGVTLYRTSWCGVCVSAAKYFRQNDIAFVEKDIEKDPGAQAEMLQKAQSVGRKPTGVPVIDFHGHLMFGFDRATIESLVRKQKAI